jgi:hypothetical protein
MTKWQEVLRNSVKGDAIKASTLRKIPHLKTCPNWEMAEFLGTLFYKVKYATYDGGLVKYGGRIYYVNNAQIKALRPFIRWNLTKAITVLES